MTVSEEPTPRIWVLTDDKPGNRTQSIGVAEKLPWPYEEKNIRFNRLSRLPNRLLGGGKQHATRTSVENMQAPWPDIAIAAGRRLAPLLRYIKRKNPHCHTLYIMRPQTSCRHYDLVAIPEHDKPVDAPNLIRSCGPPHALSIEKVTQAAEEWRDRLPSLPSPKIALLVGGPSRSAHYTAQDFHELGEMASQLARAENGSLMVTTSRRTGKTAIDYLRLALSVEHELYRWEPDKPNPYHAFLGLADAVIVTGDSMSMCAEACALGKPVFIFIPKQGNLSSKLRHFHHSLFEKKLAQPLTFGVNLAWSPAAALDEASHIAQKLEALVRQTSDYQKA